MCPQNFHFFPPLFLGITISSAVIVGKKSYMSELNWVVDKVESALEGCMC